MKPPDRNAVWSAQPPRSPPPATPQPPRPSQPRRTQAPWSARRPGEPSKPVPAGGRSGGIDPRLVSAVKIPAVTLGFWVVKVLATTLGETGGDTVTMTLKLGYLIGSGIFLGLLAVFAFSQIRARMFRPALYWATIIASTTAGTTMADFTTRSLGIGYTGGSALLLGCVLVSLAAWRWALGSVAINTVITPSAEVFYWLTITFSQTLGTALGDWAADTGGLGYLGGAGVFGALLAGLAGLYAWTGISRVGLFWTAFILTRPLGATVGDFLDKPHDHGGLALSRPFASAVLAAAMVVCILLFSQGAAAPRSDTARQV